VLALVISLYVLSAVLPLTGLALIFLRARSESAELAKAPKSPTGATSFGQFDVLVKHLHAASETRPKAVLRDFIFIGVGVGSGAIGSLLSLTL